MLHRLLLLVSLFPAFSYAAVKFYDNQDEFAKELGYLRLDHHVFRTSGEDLGKADQLRGDLMEEKSLYRHLTFDEVETLIPINFGISKLSTDKRNELKYSSKTIKGTAGALGLGSSENDDVKIFFNSALIRKPNTFRRVFAVALELVNNENMQHESLSVFDNEGHRRDTVNIDKNVKLSVVDGLSFSFVGIISDYPIGEVQFDEDNQKAEDVLLYNIHFGLRDAHIFDDWSEFSKSIFWVAFNLFVVAMLCIDFFYVNQGSRISFHSAVMWSLMWISLALFFAGGVYIFAGQSTAVLWITCYLLEKFLSIDNLFVFLTVFQSFKTPVQHQYKALMWGIIGAIIMRTVFILTGAMLVEKFQWILSFFGVFLIYTAVKMLKSEDELEISQDNSLIFKIFRQFFNVTKDYDSQGSFFVPLHSDLPMRSQQQVRTTKLSEFFKVSATPLFVVLLVIETTDVVFAVDSIPAILAITTDPFIAYTSNIFAILGLRALYFCLQTAMHLFHYLPLALSFILGFIGLKLILAFGLGIHIPTELALVVVIGSCTIAVIASLKRGINK